MNTIPEDLQKLIDKGNWYYISWNQKLSESFIREFQDEVDWGLISEYQNLSESFIREFCDRVSWDLLKCNIHLPRGLAEKLYKEYISGKMKKTGETKMKKSIVETLNSDRKAAQVRIISKKMIQGTRAALSLGAKKIDPITGAVIEEVLKTEAGESLLALLAGIGVSYISDDKRVQAITEECRIAGMAGIGNSLTDTAIEIAGPLLGIVKEAANSLPIEEDIGVDEGVKAVSRV